MKKFLVMVLVLSLVFSTVAFAEKKTENNEAKIHQLEDGDITYTSTLMDDGTGRYEVTATIVKHGNLLDFAVKKVSTNPTSNNHIVMMFMGDFNKYFEFPNANINHVRVNRDDEILSTDEDGNYVVTFQLNSNFDHFKILVNMQAGKSHVFFREIFSENLLPKVTE